MSRTPQALLLVAAGLLGPAPAPAADSSFRCDGGLVSVGDSKVDLLARCGEPTLVEERPAKQWTSTGARAFVTVERWTYNFGPNRFLQFVTLVTGKVTAVERGSYGYPPERLRPTPAPRTACSASGPSVGDSSLDLLARCGEPTARESRLELRPTGDGGSSTVQVEIWTWDFGPRHFQEIATLEDGKVTEVGHGGYGYAR
jgi:hypothetical protein